MHQPLQAAADEGCPVVRGASRTSIAGLSLGSCPRASWADRPTVLKAVYIETTVMPRTRFTGIGEKPTSGLNTPSPEVTSSMVDLRVTFRLTALLGAGLDFARMTIVPQPEKKPCRLCEPTNGRCRFCNGGGCRKCDYSGRCAACGGTGWV